MKAPFRVVALLMLAHLLPMPSAMAREAKPLLTREEALSRVAVVEKVRYDLDMQLDAEKDFFTGTVKIAFNLKRVPSELNLDFVGGIVNDLTINGAVKDAKLHNGFSISLPTNALKTGANEVVVRYQHPYSNDGSGLYRFQDPVDKRVYLYTHFEPYDANQLFPGFDQPDLKATYRLTVAAPNDWQVITSVREKSVEDKKDSKLWQFPESQSFSTYLFSLHAGPYQVWEKDFRIPLRLFARQSVKDYVHYQDWFNVTEKGFDFFESYFDEPYPFKKYDQIIVADFNAGAMENVAAVTFSERYLVRGKLTQERKIGHANTILHEMAHMWFGNLVTMRWWDDLWLNESFATYMAYQGLAQGMKVDSAWRDFFRGTKTWAYWEDQAVTTHPITADVKDTDGATANFDGITYGKGASVLRQIDFRLGKNGFRDGVREYFNKYAFQNTSLAEFIDTLAKSSGQDLGDVRQKWLVTAGVNRLQADFVCDKGDIKSLTLVQKSDDRFPMLREHHTQVALLYNEDGKVVAKEVTPVVYKSAKTGVGSLAGKECPVAVYPNYGDYDYVHVELDSQSQRALMRQIGAVEEPMLRLMLWKSFYDQMREAQLPLQEFAVMVRESLKTEQNEDVLRLLVKYSSDPLMDYLVALNGPNSAEYKQWGNDFAKIYWQRLEQATSGSDLQQMWFDLYVGAASGKDAESHLTGFLKGQKQVAGIEMDQDRRWRIIYRLSEMGAKNANALRMAEEKKDPSHSGRRMSLAVQAVYPQAANKAKWWKEIFNLKSPLNPSLKGTLADSLFPREQQAFMKPYINTFFHEFPVLVKKTQDNLTYKIVGALTPAMCSAESNQSLEGFLKKNADLPKSIQRRVKIALDEDLRCVKIKNLAARFARARGNEQG